MKEKQWKLHQLHFFSPIADLVAVKAKVNEDKVILKHLVLAITIVR